MTYFFIDDGVFELFRTHSQAMSSVNRVARLNDFSRYKNNPCISYGNDNLFTPDPRIPSNYEETATVKDQGQIREAYQLSPRHISELLRSKKETLELQYSPIKSGGPTKARVNIKLGTKSMKLLSEIGQVIATNVSNDVCRTYSEGYPVKNVDIESTDYDTIVNKTNWEIVIGIRSIETEETDGTNMNAMNYPMMQFFSQMRNFERAIVTEIANMMIRDFDATKKKTKILPELAGSTAMKTALATGNASEVTNVIFRDHFVPLVRQSKLSSVEVDTITTEYEKAFDETPEDDNMQVLFGSDKMTIKTKQWYRSDPGFSTDGYTDYALEVSKNTGCKWNVPRVYSADGETEFAVKDINVGQGDAVGVFFTPAFIVYETGGQVKCGFNAQWTAEMMIFRKKKAYQPLRTGGVNKRLKLGSSDSASLITEKAQQVVSDGGVGDTNINEDQAFEDMY